MDEEMEMEVEVLEAVEIDLDFEFEASRFFDFTREETEEEACDAELWFESAKSYPPSPFISNLFSMEDIFAGGVNFSPKSEYAYGPGYSEQDHQIAEDYQETGRALPEAMQVGNLIDDQSVPYSFTTGSCRGLTFYDHFSENIKSLKTKPPARPYKPRSSTLMKPTASQLAKQNPRGQVGGSRLQKLQPDRSNAHCGVEIQASKRQKLDGGHLRKLGDTMQQSNLVHKVPKKVGDVPGISHARMKITIPVEPDLSTSNRAQRPVSTKKPDNLTGRIFAFKARPLNRKILDAPTLPLSKKSTPQVPVFDVFNLKTMDRAQQNTPATASSSRQKSFKGIGLMADPSTDACKSGRRIKAVNSQNEDIGKSGYSFKARPLDKKIFTSKGDLGVFKNTKRALTVPKEFDFQTEKRKQQKPLSELFGKLSLAPEFVSKVSAPSKFPQHSYLSSKGSKENRAHTFQRNLKTKDSPKDKPLRSWGRRDQ